MKDLLIKKNKSQKTSNEASLSNRMRLLVITQKVDRNDPILGFFHRWIEEFAKHCESAIVICLQKGEFALPENVKVLSLGKEEKESRSQYLCRFYKHIWQERKNYDSVFVHMNPEYVVLGGLFWRMWDKKILMWYVHRQVNLKLWLAEKFTNKVFSSTPEAFRLRSKKVSFVGHGIDTKGFKFLGNNEYGNILHVGRITRIKNIETIVKAVGNRGLTLVGEPVTKEDKVYKKELENLAKEQGVNINWMGAVSNSEMPEIYSQHFASVNAAPRGGMDKVVLESFAVGCPAFTSNEAFREFLGEYGSIFMYDQEDPIDLSSKLDQWSTNLSKESILRLLSEKVLIVYSVKALIPKILNK